MPKPQGAQLTEAQIEEWNVFAEAIGHPLRIKILIQLADSTELSPKRFSECVGRDLPGVSYHFKILRKTGMVVVARKVPKRGAKEHLHTLTSLGTETAARLLEGR